MQRVQKQGSESENAQRTAQAKFTSWSRENERANAIDDSPAMIAQRKKLNSLFGGAIQRVEDEEPLQGKFETAQRVEEEEPLQGKFEAVQRVEEEEPLQGKFEAVQRVEEEEPLQGKFETAQRAEEEEPLQGRFETAQRVEEEEPLQGKFEAVQRVEEEESLQGKFEAASFVQLKEEAAKPNNTGLPDNLKSGIENLSGMSMDNVKVHYNSSQPAQLNALAYAQGTDIHVAPGQEQHLPHEAWHVVQQAQGRVKPTMQMKEGVPVNDDAGLEHEADAMGAKAMQMASAAPLRARLSTVAMRAGVVQGKLEFGTDFEAHHLTSMYSEDAAAARYRSRRQGNSIINRGDIDTESKAIQNESVAGYGIYDFKVTPNVSTLKADLSTTDPQKIDITEHRPPTLMGFKEGAAYNITHLHASGALTANKGSKWLDPAYGQAYEARSITIQVRGKDNKQKGARLTEIDTALGGKGSISTRTKGGDKITLSYANDGEALTEFNQLDSLLAGTGDYKMTCKLTADYIKQYGN